MPVSKPHGVEMIGRNDEKVETAVDREFAKEFTYFAVHRSEVRRFLPTADFYPRFFELICAAKKFYAGLPRQLRNAPQPIPFRYFGRDWLLRANFVRVARPGEVHLSICSVKPRAALATVPVLIAETWESR